ncbi:DUF982 domain-containing protein [Shinella sp.]|uniref:DUF982 domain-containing protein n=1 Tax=Shinella sp. TaxID=1870904 RepID=UPI0028AE8AC7|nr:DUF982 domain-containing protein [Shinella sp.]
MQKAAKISSIRREPLCLNRVYRPGQIGNNEMLSVIWDKALAILLPGMPRAIEIKDPRNAMFVLAERWPVTYGRAFQRALAFWAKAIEGKCSPSRARLAFLAAAREANVPVVR